MVNGEWFINGVVFFSFGKIINGVVIYINLGSKLQIPECMFPNILSVQTSDWQINARKMEDEFESFDCYYMCC